MEGSGLLVDVSYLQRCIPTIKQRIYELEAEAHALAGHAFMLTSPQQVSTVLYDELNLTKKPQPGQAGQQGTKTNTSSPILQDMQAQHPLPGLILQHRAISKLLCTYVEPFIEKAMHSDDGRLRSSFLQLNTVTGRLASKNPNLQNLPRTSTDVTVTVHSPPAAAPAGGGFRAGSAMTAMGSGDGSGSGSSSGSGSGSGSSSELNINIRRALVAAPGCVFVASDFRQLEVRILAHFSEDRTLQRFLCDGGDPFTSLASDWLGIHPQSVTETERAKAKQCVYGE